MKYQIDKYDINSLIKNFFDGECPDYISSGNVSRVNKTADYDIIREVSHDGTLYFTIELITRAISPLIYKQSFLVGDEPSDMNKVRYVVGDISICSVFGRMDINGINMNGVRQRIRIPVKVIK